MTTATIPGTIRPVPEIHGSTLFTVVRWDDPAYELGSPAYTDEDPAPFGDDATAVRDIPDPRTWTYDPAIGE